MLALRLTTVRACATQPAAHRLSPPFSCFHLSRALPAA